MEFENNQFLLINEKNLEETLRRIIRSEMGDFSQKVSRVPRTLTRDEAARLLKVNPNTISNYIKEGRLQNRGIGRKILLHDTDVELISTSHVKNNKNW